MDPAQVGMAALCTLPFLALVIVLYFMDPPNLLERFHADPLLEPLHEWLGEFSVPIVSALVAGAWLRTQRPGGNEIRTGLGEAGAGAALALAATLLLRLIAGEQLPAFIPPEESAKPGMMQGLSAGLIEEVLFRLSALPLLYFGLRKSVGETRAKLIAVVATGLLFALSHELAGNAFEMRLFVTRAVLPGCIMSALAFAISPAFVVTMHCTAHLAIPFLFR